MKGAWRVARVAGVDFYMHWSFSLIIPWMILQSAYGHREIEALIFIFVAMLLLFGCVALHELGHAWMALRLNVVVRSVTLLPIGGLAQIQAVPDKPLREFLIAAAGPLVNFAIAIGLVVILLFVDSMLLVSFLTTPLSITEAIFSRAAVWQSPLSGFIVFLLLANIALFVFNLIPIFPMDGGRMLRALLSIFFSYTRATQLAVAIGQLIAGLMLFTAWHLKNFGLMLAAIFVFVAGLPFFIGQGPRRGHDQHHSTPKE